VVNVFYESRLASREKSESIVYVKKKEGKKKRKRNQCSSSVRRSWRRVFKIRETTSISNISRDPLIRIVFLSKKLFLSFFPTERGERRVKYRNATRVESNEQKCCRPLRLSKYSIKILQNSFIVGREQAAHAYAREGAKQSHRSSPSSRIAAEHVSR